MWVESLMMYPYSFYPKSHGFATTAFVKAVKTRYLHSNANDHAHKYCLKFSVINIVWLHVKF